MTTQKLYKKTNFLKHKLSTAITLVFLGNTGAYAQQADVAADEAEVEVKSAAEIAAAKKAEEAKKQEAEIIEVTGFRSSATEQLNAKRFAKNVSDSIYATDMGKMADANIAEAMSRIAGIGIDRVDGEGTGITIRGVEGGLNNVQMNGVTMSSNTDISDSGGAGNSIDFSSMPADMLRSIEVIKSPSANHDEGSLGGTVRLNTWKPLDIKEPRTIIRARAVYNDLSGEFSPNLGISFGNNFSDNFGMTAAVNFSEKHVRQDKLQNWRWLNRNNTNPSSLQTGELLGVNYWTQDTPVYDDDGNQTNVFEPGVGNLWVFDPLFYEKNFAFIKTENLSVNTSFQYQINDDASVWFDVAHSDRRKETTQYNQTIQNLFTGASEHIIDEEAQTSVVINGPAARARMVSLYLPLDTSTTTFGLNYQQLLFDGSWTLDAKFGYSKSSATMSANESRQILFNSGAANAQAATIDWRNDDGGYLLAPDITVSGSDDGSFPSDRIPMQNIQSPTRDSGGKQFTYQIDFQGDVEFGPIVGIGMGAKLVSNERYGKNLRVYYSLDNVALDGAGNPILDDEGNQIRLGDITVGDYNLAFPGDDFLTRVIGNESNGWLVPDMDTIFDTFVPGNPLDQIDRDGNLISDVLDDLDESTTTNDNSAIYLMADYELFDGKLLGDFGVRWVKTEALARGRAGFNFSGYNPDGSPLFDDNGDAILDDNGDPVLGPADFSGARFSISDVVFGEVEYYNALPSFNARYMLSEEMLLRFSVAKAMARPNPSRLVPGYAITSREDTDPTANGGNPGLDPTQVIQYDLSWEWYFDETAMVSVAGFYKDFETMTYNRTEERGFSDTECATAEEFPEDQQQYRDLICARILDGVATSSLVNGDGGKVFGAELQYQQDFAFLPGWAQYFGAVVNYTYSDSEATFVDKEQNETTSDLLDGFPMRNTSKNTFNSTLYWENEGLSLRLAYNYRSKSLANPAYFDGVLWTDDRDDLAFSANYKVNKKLSFNFSITNLTDSYNRQFVTRLQENTENGLLSEGNALDGGVPEWRTFTLSHHGRDVKLGMTYRL